MKTSFLVRIRNTDIKKLLVIASGFDMQEMSKIYIYIYKFQQGRQK